MTYALTGKDEFGNYWLGPHHIACPAILVAGKTGCAETKSWILSDIDGVVFGPDNKCRRFKTPQEALACLNRRQRLREMGSPAQVVE